MGIGDTGISPSYKVPRYIAKIVFAAGAVSAGSQRLACLLVGMIVAGATIVPDTAPTKCTSEDDAIVMCGSGRAQLAQMFFQAVKIPSADIYLAAVTEPGGGTQATVTCVITGTPGSGTLRYRLGGTNVVVNVAASMTIDDVGAAIAAAFTAKSKLPASCAYNSGTDTVTWTIANKGASGRDWILYHDPTDKPSTLTLTHTGSATLNTNGYRFGAAGTGAGAEDVTTLLTKLTTKRYARIAAAQNDATNAALWETHVNTKAGPLALNLEQISFGHNGTLVAAQSLAQTTLNAFRASVLWMRNSESHPCEVAAAMTAIRSVNEQTNPVPDYDGLLIAGLKGQEFDGDLPTDPEQDTALNNGVTPITTVNGEARLVRAICSYCLNGSAQDDRCLDLGDPVMTDYATLDLKLLYETEFRPANPLVGPDPAEGEEPPPAGVAFPKLWSSKAADRLQTYYNNGWLEQRPVGIWAPVSTFNKVGKYIATETPLAVRRVQHRLDNVVRQISSST